ncbi:hypothetical protein TNCV_37361 [Trichonephila clavipes]|nr:hypothetical protein TNCV_37361 [Trichonephila clavipes]
MGSSLLPCKGAETHRVKEPMLLKSVEFKVFSTAWRGLGRVVPAQLSFLSLDGGSKVRGYPDLRKPGVTRYSNLVDSTQEELGPTPYEIDNMIEVVDFCQTNRFSSG